MFRLHCTAYNHCSSLKTRALLSKFQVAAVSVDKDDASKPVQDKYYLLQIKQTTSADGQLGSSTSSTTDDKSSVFEKCMADSFQQLNVAAILNTKNNSNERLSKTQKHQNSPSTSDDLRKRKVCYILLIIKNPRIIILKVFLSTAMFG